METKEKGINLLSNTKKVLLTIFIFSLVLFLVISYVVYNILDDDYNYTEFNAKTIDEKIKFPWVVIKNIDSFEIDKSKVIIYFHNKKDMEASCQGENEKIENTFKIKQSECFFKLPKQKFSITSNKAKIVIVEAKEELVFSSNQTWLEIASNNSDYKFEINGTQNYICELNSKENGTLIKGTFNQSLINLYSKED